VAEAKNGTKAGVKKVAGKDGMSLVVADSGTGEIVAPVGFHQVVPVDRTQFVKMYIQGVRALQGLSLAGVKVFELIFEAVQKYPGTDKIILHFMDTVEDGKPKIPRATFHRGLRELLDKQFIYESLTPNVYWINVTYMFNGDRLAFIKEYRLTDQATLEAQKKKKENDERQGALNI
jgi:hypothetical protein